MGNTPPNQTLSSTPSPFADEVRRAHAQSALDVQQAEQVEATRVDKCAEQVLALTMRRFWTMYGNGSLATSHAHSGVVDLVKFPNKSNPNNPQLYINDNGVTRPGEDFDKDLSHCTKGFTLLAQQDAIKKQFTPAVSVKGWKVTYNLWRNATVLVIDNNVWEARY